MASPASRKRLHDLVEDVLIVILIECDVAGVLALSETSRFFHHLAFTNTVWHALVTELVRRGFVDRRSDDEDLKDLSTEQLIGIVKRMLHGPKAWAGRPSKSSPVAVRWSLNVFRKLVRKPAVEAAAPLGEAKRIVLHPEIAQGPAMWHGLKHPKLLPGGKYVLFLNSARLECWNVFENRLIWKHAPSMDHTSVIDFAVEIVECDLAVILTCQHTDFGGRGPLFVEISSVNFTTGVSDLELVSRVSETSFDLARIDCAVCGDIVAVYFRCTQLLVLLINWRTSSRILVSSHETSQMVVIPGYLILVLLAPRGKHRLAFSPFASFWFWEPNSSMEAPSTSRPVAKLPFFSGVDKPISLTNQPPDRRVENRILRKSIWVHESPLQRGRFKIWLHTCFNVAPALCSFECVKRDAGLSWRFLSTTHMPMHIYPKRISLSGHTLGYCRGYRGLRIIPPVPTNKKSARGQIVELAGRSPFTHLSSFSGTLTYSTDKEVVVVYYD